DTAAAGAAATAHAERPAGDGVRGAALAAARRAAGAGDPAGHARSGDGADDRAAPHRADAAAPGDHAAAAADGQPRPDVASATRPQAGSAARDAAGSGPTAAGESRPAAAVLVSRCAGASAAADLVVDARAAAGCAGAAWARCDVDRAGPSDVV